MTPNLLLQNTVFRLGIENQSTRFSMSIPTSFTAGVVFTAATLMLLAVICRGASGHCLSPSNHFR